MEWVVLACVFVAFAVGVYVGIRRERAVTRAAVRELAEAGWKPTLTAEAPIDHDAMYRIIKAHQGDR